MTDASALLSKVLPAATASELLSKLRVATGANAVGVHRVPWPDFLMADEGGVRAIDTVPGDANVIGPGFVVGNCHASVVEPLLRQAASMDAALEHAKLSAMAELAAGAGHEVNNPLATIAARATKLRREEPNVDRRLSLESILSQAFRARDMIGDLMLYARPPEPAVVTTDLRAAVLEVVEDLHAVAAAKSCQVNVLNGDPVEVAADETQLRVVLSELLRNAIEASPDGGSVETQIVSDDEVARYTVLDDGPGLEELTATHLFDPFFSGRQAGRGLGFGLAKCWRIVVRHGGSLRVTESDDRTAFEVLWPKPKSRL